MTEYFLVVLGIFLSIPVIAILDRFVLGKYIYTCPFCNRTYDNGFWAFLPATAFELLFFIAGIALGITWCMK